MRRIFTLLALLSLLTFTVKAQITEKPSGEERLYVRTGSAFAPEEGSADIKLHSQLGKAARIVYDADGTTVYISNPVSLFPDPVWVRGTLNAAKNIITVQLGQVLGHSDKHSTDYQLALLRAKQVGTGDDAYYEYERDESQTTIDYSVSGGYVTLMGTSEECVLGAVYADNGQWAGYADFNTEYTALNDQTTEAPSGLATSVYTLYATDGDKGVHRTINVGFTDTEVYVQGLSKLMPEAWAKGTFNDNKRLVTFPIQFLGITATDYPVYLCRYAGGTAIDELVLVYESETGNFYISKRDEPIMLENASKTEAGYYYKYENLTAAPGLDATVAPADDTAKSSYMLKGYTYSGDVSQLVNVVTEGDKAYIQGISTQLPDSWIVGTQTADGYEFASPQFLGYVDGKPYYFIAEDNEGIIASCPFTYDAATATFATTTTCAVSTDRVKAREVTTFYDMTLAPYHEATGAVPVDPTIDDVYPSDCELDYTIDPVSTDGDDLDASKLSMVFYSDIEGVVAPITFTPDEFPEFEEETTAVPVNFESDNFSGGTGECYMIYPENDAYNRIGMQLVYTTDEGETRSNIVWYVLKAYTGISSAIVDSSAAVRYYRLDGMATTSPRHGVVIVKNGSKVRKVMLRK